MCQFVKNNNKLVVSNKNSIGVSQNVPLCRENVCDECLCFYSHSLALLARLAKKPQVLTEQEPEAGRRLSEMVKMRGLGAARWVFAASLARYGVFGETTTTTPRFAVNCVGEYFVYVHFMVLCSLLFVINILMAQQAPIRLDPL